MSKQAVNQLEARIEELTQANRQLQNRAAQLEISAQLSQAISSTLNADSLSQQFAEIIKSFFGLCHVSIFLTDPTGRWAEYAGAAGTASRTMKSDGLRLPIDETSLVGWISQNQEPYISYKADKQEFTGLLVSKARSEIALPLYANNNLIGIVDLQSIEEEAFDQDTVAQFQAVVNQIAPAIEKAQLYTQTTTELADIQTSLHETHLMLDISRRLSGASSLKDVYETLAQSVVEIGAERCVLFACDELNADNVPTCGELVFISDKKLPTNQNSSLRFPLEKYPALYESVQTQETLVIENVTTDQRITEDWTLILQPGAVSVSINPLVTRSHVTGLLIIEHKSLHPFSQRELALYRTLANQSNIALEHAYQIRRTEEALAETQTLYRAGRVLAGASDLQDILEQALIEFVHSLWLDQGGITLLTNDGQFGQLMAYLEGGQLQDIQRLRFAIDKSIPYQKILLEGQPFVSTDVANDSRLDKFRSFNPQAKTTALLEAPIIVGGETIGWIGADAIDKHREFKQREIDLARAMADQIAIAIQNRRLLEQTEYQANQLRAVATVGEAVTGLMDLNEVLKGTVDLIRDSFGFYHVSIFLVDEAREWAVVKASTGEVGKIMVERPHRLGVGSNSIVGFVTANAKPRIALDVGQDKVHFNNPLLPDTRSEMALPLISRGTVIGALDVQSVAPNAFTQDDVETLQIMTGQLVSAIENARLFEQTQRRLIEQAMLYRIGTKIGGTLKLQETTNILVEETAEALDVAECALALLENNVFAYVISDHVKDYSFFRSDQGQRFNVNEFASWPHIIESKQEFIVHIDDPHAHGWEYEYLKDHRGTALAIVPILLRNEVIGLLEVYDDKPGRRFKQEDISLLDSIALQAANAIENAHLFGQTQKTLERTQTLYRISDILAGAGEPTTSPEEQREIFEAVLGGYLTLLGLNQGTLMIYDRKIDSSVAQARYINGESVETNLVLPVEDDLVFQQLQQNPTPLVIENVATNPLIKDNTATRGQLKAVTMLFIPLMTRGQVAGSIVVDATTAYTFTQDDIEIGEAIADQLNIWLENRQLLVEAQYRSNLLQTAAQVSRASSSILDVTELIETSVNLIRDHFDFYYVGLFLVDNKREYAVLRAGTGEAGQIQLERKHKLKIGEGSMIGWSVANRKARIALDVGEEKVHFKNPILPDTHSEMALPLISRDEVIGALTVQSVERGAFTNEDITLLQTMADQLANAIENALLFSQTQEALAEAETLYQVTQQLSSARTEDKVYELAIDAIAGSGVDSSAIYIYLDNDDDATTGQMVEQKAVWTVSGEPAVANGTRLKAEDFVVETLVPHHGAFIVEDIETAETITEHLRKSLLAIGIASLMALPLSTYQHRLGFLLAAYKNKEDRFTQNQIRFFTTIAQQMVIALENLRLINASQRRARREEIIREISFKIRNAVDLDDILKTTVTELGKVVGTSRGNITLGINTTAQETNGSKSSQDGDTASASVKDKQVIGNKESKNYGQ